MMTQYSSIQKISLAGMVIGSLMCLVGACAPYWIVSDPQGFDEIGMMASLASKVASKIVKGNMGLMFYCFEVLGQSKCEAFSMSDDSGWFHSVRVAAAACLLLGGICGILSLCLACCGCCKRFIVLGILSFLAAVCGGFTAIVYSKNTDVFTSQVMGFQLTTYGWAFYMFALGAGIMGVVSFTACFSAPENPMRGMIMSQPAGANVIVTTSTSTAPYIRLQDPNPHVTVVSTNGY